MRIGIYGTSIHARLPILYALNTKAEYLPLLEINKLTCVPSTHANMLPHIGILVYVVLHKPFLCQIMQQQHWQHSYYVRWSCHLLSYLCDILDADVLISVQAGNQDVVFNPHFQSFFCWNWIDKIQSQTL